MAPTATRLAMGIVLAAALLAACARTQDPSQAGFFSGTANIVDGTYDRRIYEREAALASARSTSQQLEAELAASQAEAMQLQQQQTALQQRLYALDTQNAGLRQQIAVARQQAAADDASLRQLETRLADLERRRTELRDVPTADPGAQAELERLERETAEIRRAIDEIMELNRVVE